MFGGGSRLDPRWKTLGSGRAQMDVGFTINWRVEGGEDGAEGRGGGRMGQREGVGR